MQKVYIGNFSYDTTQEYLQSILNSCGDVKNLRMVYDQTTGLSKGYAFCNFVTKSAATFAVENLNGVFVNGRKLRVRWAHAIPKPY